VVQFIACAMNVCPPALFLATASKSLLELGESLPGGSNSVVECQLPKLDVAGSIPVSRSKSFVEGPFF
jgi:hypothetical protein